MDEELGRTPLQNEFCAKIPRYYVVKGFGTYNNLLKAAGLETNKEGVGRKKSRNLTK
jgi:hypothetical protein